MNMSKEEKNNLESLFNKEGTFDCNITVLTTSYWPTYKSFNVPIPIEIENKVNSFKVIYS